MQYLLNKQLYGRHGIERALAPSVADVMASLFDAFFAKELIQIILDPPQRLGENIHPWSPVGRLRYTTTFSQEILYCANARNARYGADL